MQNRGDAPNLAILKAPCTPMWLVEVQCSHRKWCLEDMPPLGHHKASRPTFEHEKALASCNRSKTLEQSWLHCSNFAIQRERDEDSHRFKVWRCFKSCLLSSLAIRHFQEAEVGVCLGAPRSWNSLLLLLSREVSNVVGVDGVRAKFAFLHYFC